MSLYDAIGLHLEPSDEEGESHVWLAVSDAVRNPNAGVHGGAIASLVDTTAAQAVRSILGDAQALMYTVDLTVSYMRPVKGSRMDGHGRALRVGRTLAFAEAEVLDEDGTLAAKGRVTFALPRPAATDEERS